MVTLLIISNFVLHLVSTCWETSFALRIKHQIETQIFILRHWVQFRLILGWKLSLLSCTFKIYRCIFAKLHFYLYKSNITPFVLWPDDICIQGHSTLEGKTDCGRTTIALCWNMAKLRLTYSSFSKASSFQHSEFSFQYSKSSVQYSKSSFQYSKPPFQHS